MFFFGILGLVERSKRDVQTSPGFVLITVLIIVLLMSGLTALMQIQVIADLRLSSDVEGRLRSLVLAENGIALSKAAFAGADPNRLLTGPNGNLDCSQGQEWRSPLPLDVARQVDVGLVSVPCDDGLLAGWNAGYDSVDGGRVFFRYSNNPDEPPERDEDGIVLVRSLAILPAQMRGPFSDLGKNHVALVEAWLRREKVFESGGALTVVGSLGELVFVGDQFRIEGSGRSGVLVCSELDSSLEGHLDHLLTEFQARQIAGAGRSLPSIEVLDLKADHPVWAAVLREPPLWRHLRAVLRQGNSHSPRSDSEGLQRLNGGSIKGVVSGLFLAEGDVRLEKNLRLSGLLIHLGGGSLQMEGGALVRGAVWVSSLETTDEHLKCEPVRFRMSGTSRIVYDQSLIQQAVAHLPPTQLGWRILFPEMEL